MPVSKTKQRAIEICESMGASLFALDSQDAVNVIEQLIQTDQGKCLWTLRDHAHLIKYSAWLLIETMMDVCSTSGGMNQGVPVCTFKSLNFSMIKLCSS